MKRGASTILVIVLITFVVSCDGEKQPAASEQSDSTVPSKEDIAKIDTLIIDLCDEHPFVRTNAFYHLIAFAEKGDLL